MTVLLLLFIEYAPLLERTDGERECLKLWLHQCCLRGIVSILEADEALDDAAGRPFLSTTSDNQNKSRTA
jgi:hypothetical protein